MLQYKEAVGARTAGTMRRMQAQTKATTRPYGTKQRSRACCASALAGPPDGVWLPGSLACAAPDNLAFQCLQIRS